ncbi:MAG: 1-acyl-sn-glycerol-3-phosphate acyltransferase [Kiritimatiellia bacterium]
MGWARLILRSTLSLFFCLLMYLLGLIIKVCIPGKPRLRYRIVTRCTGFWGRTMARIWGMKIRVSGPIPATPFFLVSNHVSYTDILLLCAVSPAWFVSKSEVAGWPGIGALTRIGPTIYINRESRKDVHRMNQLISDLIRDGGGVGFFPEGTTSDGRDVLPFKPSLLQAAIDLEIPVTTSAICYQTTDSLPPPEEWVAWIGDEAFAPHAKRLLSGPGFTAHVRFSPDTLRLDNRKDLAVQAHAQVKNLLLDLQAELA